MTEYRLARPQEEADVLDFINMVFSMHSQPHDFAALLPKVYAHPGFARYHYVAVEDGHIRGTVALLPLTLRVEENCALKAGYIGSVAVHPYSRGAGHMKALMRMALTDAEAQGYDLLALGGRRQRYAYFGFEKGGQRLTFSLNSDNVRHAMADVDEDAVRIREVTDAQDTVLDDVWQLSRRQMLTCERDRERLLDIFHSWHNALYVLEDARQDGTFLGTVIGMVEGGVYVHKPECTTSTISRMTYRYQGSDGNGKAGALTINYKIEDAAYVVNSDTTHVFVTLTSRLENINGQTFSGNPCSPNTWALHGKLPENAEQIILNKAMSLSPREGDCTVNLPGDEDHKVVYDGQPHEATIELVSDGLDYLLDKYETVQTEDGGRALKVYYYNLATGELKEEAPTEIGTYQVLYKKGSIYFNTNWVFKITENIHSVTVTDGFIVKVEHPGAVGTDDTTGDDTTEDPISTATVQYGDTVTVTIDASKIPSGMVFDRWETTPVGLQLTPADGESYKTVTFTMPAEDVTLRAVPCTVEEKAASGGSSPLGTAALVVVGGAAAGVLVWQGYELGTELYLHSVLPSGVAIPETRGQLAVVLWQAAGSPAPAAPLAPDAADTQKAMAWVVEHALLEDKTGNFDPREPVNKTEVIRAWNQLNHQGLAQQAK